MATARIPLSEIARDPVVAAFLRRGEGEGGALMVPASPTPTRGDGMAAVRECGERLVCAIDNLHTLPGRHDWDFTGSRFPDGGTDMRLFLNTEAPSNSGAIIGRRVELEI